MLLKLSAEQHQQLQADDFYS